MLNQVPASQHIPTYVDYETIMRRISDATFRCDIKPRVNLYVGDDEGDIESSLDWEGIPTPMVTH